MTNTGRGGEMRAAHGRRGWPELVGKTYAEAEAAIKEVAPDIKKVVRVPMGSMVTQDYREVRVRALAGQHSTAGACWTCTQLAWAGAAILTMACNRDDLGIPAAL